MCEEQHGVVHEVRVSGRTGPLNLDVHLPWRHLKLIE